MGHLQCYLKWWRKYWENCRTRPAETQAAQAADSLCRGEGPGRVVWESQEENRKLTAPPFRGNFRNLLPVVSP